MCGLLHLASECRLVTVGGKGSSVQWGLVRDMVGGRHWEVAGGPPEWIWWICAACDVGRRELANWRPGGKSCSLMPVPLSPTAQTPWLIYLCIYPVPPRSQHQTLQHREGSTLNKAEKEGCGERWGGRERVTYAQWELTKHLVIKSELTFW